MAKVTLKIGSGVAALLCSASWITMAAAQEAPATAPADLIGEVIVTANRTESMISKTPIAVTAVSGEGLVTAGVTNPTALNELVPNVSIDRAAGGVQITIRGVTSTDTTEKGDPSAAFLLDGIYIARPQAQEVSFYDVARVEVLRGPQGTLYGRNTTAGLVNVITKRPEFAFGGFVNVATGNYGMVQTSGAVNVPLSDNLAMRASINYDRRDNYLEPGPLVTSKLDPFKENLSGRVQLLYRWNSGDALIVADYADIGGSPLDLLQISNFFNVTPPLPTDVNPAYIAEGKSSKDLRTLNVPIGWDISRKNDTWGLRGNVNVDVGQLTFTYDGAYREFTRDEGDARIHTISPLSYPLRFTGDYWQNSQELRVASKFDGPLSLQAGLYYFKEKSAVAQTLLLTAQANPAAIVDGTTLGFFQDPTISESYAYFGQGTYAFTDDLRLTAGVRSSHDKKSRIGATATCTSFFTCAPVAASPRNDASAKFSKTTWRLGLDYDVNDATLLYGSVSTGYKAGGFNDGCIVGTGPGCAQPASVFFYEPEELTAYEGGVKTRLLGNTLRLNLAAFMYDYSNIQLSQVVAECAGPGSAPCNVTANGGEAKVKGVELEGIWAPSSKDRFDFNGAYLDAHFTNFRPTLTTDFAGKKLDRSPEWTASVGYQRTVPLANDGELLIGLRTRYSASYTLLALGTRNFFQQPSFTKTDVTVTYNAPGKAWYLQGFLKNIENEIVVTTVVYGAARSSVQIAEPFTAGVRAGFTF